MQKIDLKYDVLKSSSMFLQRENSEVQTSYEMEVAFFSTIEQGDTVKMKTVLKNIVDNGLMLGRFSADELRQTKYWAVCCVTLATRYAIRGGLDERTAYNFSDSCIQAVDLMVNKEDVLDFMILKSIEITEMVFRLKEKKQYVKSIRLCVKYIDKNLHGDLSLKRLAEIAGVSCEYLSALFKKQTGVSLSAYIKNERLKEAAELLKSGMKISEVAYSTGFSGESYFIKCFRGKFGITPGQYQNNV